MSCALFWIVIKDNWCLPQCMLGYTHPQQTPLGRHPPRADPPGQTHPQADTPLGIHPPGQTPPWAGTSSRWPMQRTVSILLECILIING